jgi:uncharacterized protein (DUF885 family)
MKKFVLLSLVLSFISSGNLFAQSNDAAFDKIAEEFIGGWLAARPLQGTALGFHEYDGKINDFSRPAIDGEIARLKQFNERAKEFDASKLSARASVDLRILRAAIDGELFRIEEMKVFERNPMTYVEVFDINIYVKRNFAPLDDRVRSLTAIENQVPNLIAAAKTNLQEKLPKPYVELAIDITKGSADFLRKDLVDALKDLKDEQLMAQFRATNEKAAAALQEYADWLAKEKLPKATNDFALGRDKFRRFISRTELVDLTPEKILEIGTRTLKNEQQAFADAAKKIDPSKSAPEVFKQIQSEHPTPESLIPDVAKDLETIRQYLLDHHIITVPSEVRAQVTETPQYQRATSFASMDTPGPFEAKATEAYYYVTPTEKEWTDKQKEEWLTSFNYYTSDVVTIHEAYPGHYVQFLRLKASSASKAEKIFGSYAFIEGWAHYSEKMLVDEGFGSCNCPNPTPEQALRAAKYRMAQADEALLRECRLCVSIKMHTQGMSVDDATKFFQQNCYYEEKPARSEAMRGTFDPGYLNYTLGKLQILKLRDDYKRQEGANFSLQKFHDEMTDHGMPPIRLLRETMLKDKSKWNEVL